MPASAPSNQLACSPGVDADSTAGAGDTARMLNTLLSNLDGMVYRCRDDGAWTMEFVSDCVRKLAGSAPADILHNARISFDSLRHEADRSRVHELIRASLPLAGGFDCEYRIVHATGDVRWVWERGTGIY